MIFWNTYYVRCVFVVVVVVFGVAPALHNALRQHLKNSVRSAAIRGYASTRATERMASHLLFRIWQYIED